MSSPLSDLLKAAKKKPTYLLIDGDILVYQAVTSTLEEEYHRHEDAWTYRVSKSAALDDIKSKIEGWQSLLRAKKNDVMLAFGGISFRSKVFPEYKANRTHRKPLGYKAVKEWCVSHLNTSQRDWFEADDILGVETTSPEMLTHHTPVVVSSDKDMFTLPGWHLDMDEANTLVHITPAEADLNIMRQTLTGDQTDNYPGLPGVGKVGAEKILAGAVGESGGWARVRKAFRDAGFSREHCLQQARCARILRHEDLDAKSRFGIRLWEFPK